MKKYFALLLALVLCMAVAVPVFADEIAFLRYHAFERMPNDLIIDSGEAIWVNLPNNPGREGTYNPIYVTETPKRSTSSVVITIGGETETTEDNPTTGAPVFSIVPAIAVVCGAALIMRKRK